MQEICLQKTGRLKVSDSRLKVFFIIGQKKAFNGQMGRESQSCTRKEIIDISILITSRNGDWKITQSIRITCTPPTRIRQ